MSTTFELNRLARHLMKPKEQKKTASDLRSFLARREPGVPMGQLVDNARFYRMMKQADPGTLAAASAEASAGDGLLREGNLAEYEKLKKTLLPDNVVKKDEADRAEQLRVNELKPTPTAADSLKKQLADLVKKTDVTISEKTAMDDSTKAMLGLPVAGGAAGAALYGLAGVGRAAAPSLGKRLTLGGGAGAAVGAGLAGIIGLGKLLEKADPSGNTLATAVQIAPAVAAVAGAIGDMNSEKKAQLMSQIPLDQLAALADMDKVAAATLVSDKLWNVYDKAYNKADKGDPSKYPNPHAYASSVAMKHPIVAQHAKTHGIQVKGLSTGPAEGIFRVKTASVPFPKQDRPEKVKEIYAALKRDHPNMPVEKAASSLGRDMAIGAASTGATVAALRHHLRNQQEKEAAEPTRGTSFIFKEPKTLPKATIGRPAKMTDKELRSEYRRTKGLRKLVGDKPSGKHRAWEAGLGGVTGTAIGAAGRAGFNAGARGAARASKWMIPASGLLSAGVNAALTPSHWGARSGLKMRRKWIETEAKNRGIKLAAVDPISLIAPAAGATIGGIKTLLWAKEKARLENPTSTEEAIGNNQALATVAGTAGGLASGITVGMLLNKARRAL